MGNGKEGQGQIKEPTSTKEATIYCNIPDCVCEGKAILNHDQSESVAEESADFVKALGMFILDNDGKVDKEAVKILRTALIAYGYLMFKEEELVLHMASSRLVPGNTARQLIQTIKEAMGYEKTEVKETK